MVTLTSLPALILQHTEVELYSARRRRFDRFFMLVLVFFSNLVTLVILSLKRNVFEIFDFKNFVTLQTGLGVLQGH